MKHLVLYVLSLSAVVSFNPIHAQISDSIRKWSIEACFKYAAENNIEINTRKLQEHTSLQEVIASKGNQIPSLSGSADTNFNNSKSGTSANESNHFSNNGNYSVNASVILWNDHYIKNNIRQMDLKRQAAALAVQQSRNAITLLITEGFLAILLAKENLTYMEDLAATSEARVKQGQLFYDAGSIAKNNLLQLQAQWASDNYLMVQAQNAIRQHILALKQILQLPTAAVFDIVTPSSITVIALVPPLRSVQQRAFDIFPEIKMGQLDVSIAALDIAKAKAGFQPVLSATGSLGSGYSQVLFNSNFSQPAFFRQLDSNFYQRFGFDLSIPIFSNRVHQTNLAKATIGYQQANLNLENNQLVLSQEVEQAFLKATNAQRAYFAAKEQWTAASETYRVTNELFRLGGISSFDLLQQRNQYVQAVQAFTQAKYTAVLELKIYEFYSGNPIVL